MMLLHWGQIYKSVYEMPSTDRPDDAIIDNDAAFDRWHEHFVRERAVEAAKIKAQRTGKVVGDPDAQSKVPLLTPDQVRRKHQV